MYSIAFICTGNTCRSPMAEALAASRWEDAARGVGVDLRLLSAGLKAKAGQPASDHARTIISDHGGDLSAHRSRGVADVAVEEIRLFLTMTRAHRDALRHLWPERSETILTLSEFAGRDGDVADPFGGGAENYAEAFHQIRELLDAAKPSLREALEHIAENSPAAIDGTHNPEKGQSRA